MSKYLIYHPKYNIYNGYYKILKIFCEDKEKYFGYQHIKDRAVFSPKPSVQLHKAHIEEFHEFELEDDNSAILLFEMYRGEKNE